MSDTAENDDPLRPGTIAAALCKTTDTGKYHWIIYLITDLCGSSGFKYHATNQMGAAPWHYEYTRWEGLESARCVTLTPIGRVPNRNEKSADDLDAILREVPLEVPQVDRRMFDRFTCRTWFRAAIRKLNDKRMYVRCPDVDLLEDKLTRMATAIEMMNYHKGLSDSAPTQIMKATDFATPWL
ncbi:hypothetical protein K466DRAFT_588458 [Polyporus arcularius HHB13444]|uniref:Uncharacterized protein n=1 Tax=Polyporus arcularius HHB13444 TaxID=1314778 RepID=A0A5C3PGG8_9APHY|nr:hypothetical protein K466DRAFT_588458 [Polyporus arcularius HHB13444]